MKTNSLNQVTIVLVEPSHPGNIGAAARAMKTMGLSQLTLVKPKQFPHPEATTRASGATDILEQAQVVASLEEAIANCQQVVGTSARMRSINWSLKNVREWAESLTQQQPPGQIAVLFGPERIGLNNQQLQQCHHHIHIPSNPDYSSLNLASAVQLVCYELRHSLLDVSINTEHDESSQVTAGDLERYFEHLEKVLYTTGFIDPKQPKQLMARLRRIYLRADLDTQEMNILRGILTSIEKSHFDV